MRIPIKRSNATIITLRPQDGKLQQQLLGVNIITFKVVLPQAFEFAIGDYLEFEGERYTMNLLPAVKKWSRIRYEYHLTFEAPQYQLRNAQYLFWGEDNDLARNGMADFSLVGTPQDFLNLVIVNGNRIGGVWQAGNCITAEAKEIAFNSDNCLSVLQRLAQEFDTEFYFEGNTIHFARKEAALPYNFEYGKGHTLYDIERVMKDTGIVTRLYAFGSERNLPFGYRNGTSRLKLPASGVGYLEQNTNLFGVIEHTQIFDDLYPHREGTVTGIDPQNPLTFNDADMPFDLMEKNPNGSASVYKYLLPGAKAKVHFNSGNLAGYDFEISGYVHATRQFSIIPINEKFGNPDTGVNGNFALPNAALHPQVGDKYVLLDITLPQSYIDAAEAELLAKAQQYLADNSVPQTEYKVTPNAIEFSRNNLELVLGATVTLIDEPLGINKDIRITGFDKVLGNELIYQYENVVLADAPSNPFAERKYADYKQQKQIDGSTNLAALANHRSSLLDAIMSDYKTDIIGGLILTTLLQMRGADDITKAGISGLSADDVGTTAEKANPVRFWAGGTYENRHNAPFRVRHDGSFVANNAKIEGEINAISGKLKGIEIMNNGESRKITLDDNGFNMYFKSVDFNKMFSINRVQGKNVFEIYDLVDGQYIVSVRINDDGIYIPSPVINQDSRLQLGRLQCQLPTNTTGLRSGDFYRVGDVVHIV